jgi:hypothetical protein
VLNEDFASLIAVLRESEAFFKDGAAGFVFCCAPCFTWPVAVSDKANIPIKNRQIIFIFFYFKKSEKNLPAIIKGKKI